jgi:hypothetical protein
MATIALDNDILHKGSGYGLLREIIDAIPTQANEVGVLQTAKFVVRDKLRKAKLNDALLEFEQIIEQMQCLEPTESEARLAAKFEYEALRANLNVDSGESLLCAVVITRSFTKLVTGDKRAIKSLELLASSCGDVKKLAGKIVCLEQLILRIIQKTNAETVRHTICTRPSLDKTLSICFSCASPEIGSESWLQCLSIYVEEIRAGAPTLLAL